MITMENITKSYRLGEVDVPILKGIDLHIAAGEYVSIMGASGSGKSMLMNILGCLDRPTHGHYILEDRDLTTLDTAELAYIRNQKLGFVFQQFNLLARSTALENVMLPMVYGGVPKGERRSAMPSCRESRAEAALVRVGLGVRDSVALANRLLNRPNQLSGGQQQRVAICLSTTLRERPSLGE
jgi:putative ABC transport system ATP-binding protein